MTEGNPGTDGSDGNALFSAVGCLSHCTGTGTEVACAVQTFLWLLLPTGPEPESTGMDGWTEAVRTSSATGFLNSHYTHLSVVLWSETHSFDGEAVEYFF